MGVSGVGKSTVGRLLAERSGVPYSDGDDHHPAANVAKMTAGCALADDDRRPWLELIGAWLAEHDASGGVISCSALRRAHRDVLVRHAQRLVFLHLAGERALIRSRMAQREHFMPPALLDSQESILEPLQPDECGVMIEITSSPEEIVEEFLERFHPGT